MTYSIFENTDVYETREFVYNRIGSSGYVAKTYQLFNGDPDYREVVEAVCGEWIESNYFYLGDIPNLKTLSI